LDGSRQPNEAEIKVIMEIFIGLNANYWFGICGEVGS